MLEQARAETMADSAEVRPHLRLPMNSRRAEFQDSMMNEPRRSLVVRHATQDSRRELTPIPLRPVILSASLRECRSAGESAFYRSVYVSPDFVVWFDRS